MSLTSPSTFGVIGLGRMAQALLFPWLESDLVQRASVRAVVASQASAQRLQTEHAGLSVSVDGREAWAAPVVMLAVKPQQLEAVAAAAPAPLPVYRRC